jgi:cell division protein FtsA
VTSTFAAVDVGTTKVTTLVGEVAPAGELRILGVGVAPAAGLSRGMVDNIREATESVRASLEKAERASGVRILSTHVGISGTHVQSLNNRGVVAVADRTHPISHEDIARGLEAAKIVSVPTNREILHVVPRFFVVDGQDNVTDPIGMYGQRLDVEAHIITASSNAVANIVKIVESAGVRVDEVVLESLAGANAVLAAEEKRQGVIFADIGGGTTNICIFVDGSVVHSCALPIGGNHITRDLVVGLRCPYHSAEEAKELYGSALPSTVPDDDVRLEAFGSERERSYSRQQICQVIQARCEEILEMIVAEARRNTEIEMLSAGLVLTGGTARLPGLDLLAEQVTNLPARIGVPGRIIGLVDELMDPAYAIAVGLLEASVAGETMPSRAHRPAGPGLFDGAIRRLASVFRVLLPE